METITNFKILMSKIYKKISIIIPVFNEEKYIQKTIEAVINADSCGLEKEIVIVNDGSTDKTSYKVHKVIKFIKNNPRKSAFSSVKIHFIDKNKNEGKGAAVKVGFMKSTGEIVLVQDADLEYNPEDYPRLLEPFIKNDANVVYGSRFISDRPHRVLYFWHYVINVFLTTLSNALTNLNLTDMETGFKVFKGNLIRKLATQLKAKKFGFEPEVTARLAKIPKIKIFEVGISYSGRTYQEGKKINWVDGIKAVMEILKFNLFE